MRRDPTSRGVVLDTHVVLWWCADPDRLSPGAASAIHEATTVAVSAISMWEITMLVSKRRIELDRPVRSWIRLLEDQPRLRVLPLSGDIAVTAGELTSLHGDPADRMIAATALACRAHLVTKDARLLDWASSREDINAIW